MDRAGIPIGRSFGIDPGHLNLFPSCHPFDKWVNEIIHATQPMLLVLFAGVMQTTY
jgi:hypothetical protein